MRKLIAASLFVIVLVCGYFLFSTVSRNEGVKASITGSSTDMFATTNYGISDNKGGLPKKTAFDLTEGETVTTNKLTVLFSKATFESICSENSYCKNGEISLILDSGEEHSVTLGEGESIIWKGFYIKLSQIAPEQNLAEVPYRAVILVGIQ